MNSIAVQPCYTFDWVNPETPSLLFTQLSETQSTLQSATALYAPSNLVSCFFAWFGRIQSALVQIQYVFLSNAEIDCMENAVANYRTNLNGFFVAYDENGRFADAETHIACANILSNHYKELAVIIEKCVIGENIHENGFCVLQDASVEVRVLRDNLFLNYDSRWIDANQEFAKLVSGL